MATIYDLPPELVLLIVETRSFPLSALNALLLTCRTFRGLLTPILYKRAHKHTPSPLHWSAANGITNNVAPLVAAGCFVDAKDHTNMTPLMTAASHDHLDTVRAFLENGANTEVRSGRLADDGTALHIAARDGSMEVVALLLGGGADVNAREARGATPLHWAVEAGMAGCEDLVELLLDHGAGIDTAREQDGETALKMAVRRGDMRMFEKLLARGADIEVCGKLGETALMAAVACGRMDMVSVLLERGASVGGRNDYGETALHLAAGHIDSGRMLGVILDAWDRSVEGKENGYIDIRNDEGNTALHLATRDEARKERIGVRDVLRQLSEEGLMGELKVTDAEATDYFNDIIAIQKSAEASLTASVRLLLEGGASPDYVNKAGRRPLHNAAANGYVEMARLLLDHGAEVDAYDVDGQTALQRAGRVSWTMRRKPDELEGRIDVIRLLLERDAISTGMLEWEEGNQALSELLHDHEWNRAVGYRA